MRSLCPLHLYQYTKPGMKPVQLDTDNCVLCRWNKRCAVTKTVYACGIEWQHEIGETKTRLFSDIDDLKTTHTCWTTCGIVELEIKEKRWIAAQCIYGEKK